MAEAWSGSIAAAGSRRVEGPVRGNVLLRRAQHAALSDDGRTVSIARQIVAAKVQNSRTNLLRSARESPDEGSGALKAVASHLASTLPRLHEAESLNDIRGIEGESARAYFQAFAKMVRAHARVPTLAGRNRRPPRDPTNSVLSFLYALLRSECEAALEGVGLDPQVGYLHALRPGRPALALDLMEEFRPVLADRVALALFNRRQLQHKDFEDLPGGAIHLGDDARRTVITAWQQRKTVEVEHRVLGQQVPLGLLPHVQARLLARHLRGDLPQYPPYLHR
jgi:CRISPR-associated protein Cas1